MYALVVPAVSDDVRRCVEEQARQQRKAKYCHGWIQSKAITAAVRLSGPLLREAYAAGVDHQHG
eukprot:658464-Karenia_brevis.AAC.1